MAEGLFGRLSGRGHSPRKSFPVDAERGGVAGQAVGGAIPGAAGARHRTCRIEPARQAVWCRYLSLRGVRSAAFFFGYQIQQSHRMAEFLGAARRGGRNRDRPQPFHGPNRSALQALRRPSRPRFRRRSRTNRPALLHERRVTRISSCRDTAGSRRKRPRIIRSRVLTGTTSTQAHCRACSAHPLLRRPAAMPLIVRWIPVMTFSSVSPAR